MTIFRSALPGCTIRPSGWVWLPSGVEITRLPIWDLDAQLFARVGPGLMADWLRGQGLRLPTVSELDELQALALHIEPVTLPTAEMLAEAGIPRSTEAIDAYRTAHMSTIEWCRLHDTEVWCRLEEAGWTDQPIANAGKHWTEKRALYGWWRRGKKMIQTPYRGHGASHVDYASTSHAVRPSSSVLRGADTDRASAASWHAGLDLASLTLGERCCAWLGHEYGLAPREIPGPRHDPRILGYSQHCRRGGTLLGVRADGVTSWTGGLLLALQTDDADSPWCAALASETLRRSLLPGEPPPHGLRVSVRELVEDARLAGTLRARAWIPTPGSLAILARAGTSPLTGGPGHVRCVIQLDDERYLGLGGNEDDTITCAWHQLDDAQLEAWIER